MTFHFGLAEEVASSIRRNYIKHLPASAWGVARSLSGLYAVKLWLYLLKKNAPEWTESVESLKKKLGVGHDDTFWTIQLLRRTCDDLVANGLIQTYAVEDRKLRVKMRNDTGA